MNGKLEEAEELLQRRSYAEAIVLCQGLEDSPSKYHILASAVLSEYGDPAIDRAIGLYTRAIELDPNFGEAYLFRGIAHKRKSESIEKDYRRLENEHKKLEHEHTTHMSYEIMEMIENTGAAMQASLRELASSLNSAENDLLKAEQLRPANFRSLIRGKRRNIQEMRSRMQLL